MDFAFDAYVVDARFDVSGRAMFALGDGTVRFEDGTTIDAHPNGSVQSACAHPSGEGVITGGDDGRVVWSRPSGAELIGEIRNRWIDAVASSGASGLVAFAAGKVLEVRDLGDPAFARSFRHEASVSGIAFEPKSGKRIATATYGGVALWYARVADQKPQMQMVGKYEVSADSSCRRCRKASCTAGGWRTARTCRWAATRPR